MLIPRGGQFQYLFDVPPGVHEPGDRRRFLSDLIDYYNETGFPGRFAVTSTDGVFHVIPVAFKNREGNETHHTSILEKTVAIPAGERSSGEMLRIVLDSLTKRGASVWTGLVPHNALQVVITQTTASQEPARSAITRILAATGRKMSWRLFCSPKSSTCAFNVHLVPSAAPRFWLFGV